ncbi:MAG: xanthine dehydrogenase family protein subunit M [Anaerolineae bacterium]|nr:xanthine dehydrogenase family protein subunit M [Anaerolineae bacterium]
MLARPGLPSFEYIRPATPGEVVRLLGEYGPAARLLMGGTDLLVRMRNGAVRPKVVIDVKYLPGMRDISFAPAEGLAVGAAVTMNQLANHADVLAHFPLLAEAAGLVASYQLRNRATLGGNLCNASPCADGAPATLVLDGEIVLYGSAGTDHPAGERLVDANAFFVGPGQSAIQAGEFMIAVRFPTPPAGSVGRYLKLGRNKAGDLALVSVAALGFPDASAPGGARFRLALGAVAPVPLRVPQAETLLASRPPSAALFAQAAEEAARSATPIDDVRAGAAYRTAMVRTLTVRALRDVWAGLEARDG